MAVELILLENVDSLGAVGDKIRVADGYARNYLLPRGLAAPVTRESLQKIEARKRQLQQEYEVRLADARELAEKFHEVSVTIPAEANEQDKLYGSVGAQQIVSALAENNIRIDRESVVMEEPIRELGVYNVMISLAPEVQATLKVWVVKA